MPLLFVPFWRAARVRVFDGCFANLQWRRSRKELRTSPSPQQSRTRRIASRSLILRNPFSSTSISPRYEQNKPLRTHRSFRSIFLLICGLDFWFWISILQRYMQQHNEVELSALGMGIFFFLFTFFNFCYFIRLIKLIKNSSLFTNYKSDLLNIACWPVYKERLALHVPDFLFFVIC